LIVAAFLNWAQTARSVERAKAASALARAYLQDRLQGDQHEAALIALTHLVSDPSPKVRQSLAQALAGAQQAPRHIILALALDQPEISAEVLIKSEQLTDDDLIEIAANGSVATQSLIAARSQISVGLCAALCEIVELEAAILLLELKQDQLSPANLLRLAQRFSYVPQMRGLLLQRHDLPLEARQCLLFAVVDTLQQDRFLSDCLGADKICEIVSDAQFHGNLRLMENGAALSVDPLVRKLIENDNLDVRFLLCLAALGQGTAVAECLHQLTDQPPQFIQKVLTTGRNASVYTLFSSADLGSLVAGLMTDITLYWRSDESIAGLAGLVPHLQRISRDVHQALDRASHLALIERLVMSRQFDYAQEGLRHIRLNAA
jgi:uncharacterized protein (DUF2336 family)